MHRVPGLLVNVYRAVAIGVLGMTVVPAVAQKPPSAEEVKEVVGPPPPDKEPGNPTLPKGERSRAPRSERLTAPSGGFGDYLIGAGIVTAQAFFTLQFWRRRAQS